MTRYDKVLIICLLVVCLAAFAGLRFFLGRRPGDTILIRARGEAEGQTVVIPVGESQVINVSGPLGVSQVEIVDGRVHMLDSPCPDKICVKMGWINHSGQTIVCLPNQVVVTIESTTRNEYDGISQ